MKKKQINILKHANTIRELLKKTTWLVSSEHLHNNFNPSTFYLSFLFNMKIINPPNNLKE